MPDRDSIDIPRGRVEREVERERHERTLQDEAKTGMGQDEEFRNKDARERADSSNLKRHTGR